MQGRKRVRNRDAAFARYLCIQGDECETERGRRREREITYDHFLCETQPFDLVPLLLDVLNMIIMLLDELPLECFGLGKGGRHSIPLSQILATCLRVADGIGKHRIRTPTSRKDRRRRLGTEQIHGVLDQLARRGTGFERRLLGKAVKRLILVRKRSHVGG